MKVHFDYETASRQDLKKVGAFKYAECPSTRILLCAVAIDDQKPVVWDSPNPDSPESQRALEALTMAAKSGALFYAHNSQFEQAISKYLWKKTFGTKPPDISSYRCSAAMCRRAAIPSSLADAGEFLKLPQQKDKRGESLIKIFCCPRTAGKLKGQFIMPTDEGEVTVAGTKMSIAEAWKLFREYCRRDVVAEQQITKLLAPFELKGEILEAFQFDARMNDRGIPVNLDAIEKAQKIVDDASRAEIARCRAICGFNPSQRGKLLEWLQARGYSGADLQEGTMDDVLANPSAALLPEALEVLQIRSRVSFSALAKLEAMKRAACSDGRVRGTFMWSGAIRTHRWSGKIIQPQNFKRPTIKDTHECYGHICAGWDHEMIEMVYGNPLEAVASCIRHFIQDDGEFLDADYRNIEARVGPWLAGQEWKLELFRRGDALKAKLDVAIKKGDEKAIKFYKEESKKLDPYNIMGGKIFNVAPEDCDGTQRFVGKQAELAAIFYVGWERYQAMCLKYGQEISDELCKTTIEVYREENPEIVSMWKAMGSAAVNAIENPGEKFKVRGKITFYMAGKLPFRALLMRLPSGHHLVYPKARIELVWIFKKKKYSTKSEAVAAYERAKRKEQLEEGDRVWESKQIKFWGPSPLSHKWEWQTTYSGKLFENCWAGETEILTPEGWIRIDQLRDQPVWDGHEFVRHGGLKSIEDTSTIQLDTLRVTPEHKIRTPNGWVTAAKVNINEAYNYFETCCRTPRLEHKRHHGENFWVPNCASSTSSRRFRSGEMAMQMQMWKRKSVDLLRVYQRAKLLFAQMSLPGEKSRYTQHVPSSGLRCLACHAGPVPFAFTSSLAQLRWAWNNCLQKVARIFSEFLERHGGLLPAGAQFGPAKQHAKLLQKELPLDHGQKADEKHPIQCQSPNPVGPDHFDRNSRARWHREDDCFLSPQGGSHRGSPVEQTGCSEPVYDILNCGPRHQYVVRGTNKRPIVAHNCVQATAGDFLTHGVLEAERQGYNDIAMVIHDQTICGYRPEKGHTTGGFKAALCKLPEWAKDFPLEATADIVNFYTKD